MSVKIRFTDQPPGFDFENNCYIRALRKKYCTEIAEKPDFVFYGPFGTDYLKYPHSVRIFIASEPVVPNFNDCDYAIGNFPISFGDRYFRQPPLTNFGEDRYWERLSKRECLPDYVKGRRFCNFVYFNGNKGAGAELRIKFCKRLEKYKHVDCAGRILNNMDAGAELNERYFGGNSFDAEAFNDSWAESKIRFLSHYKFTIAFENTSMAGWTTEKLIHPLLANSVPIYWGNPEASDYFNPESYIDCGYYDNDFDKVIDKIIELDNDDDKYFAMLRSSPLNRGFPYQWEEELERFLSNIIERGNVPFEKNPMGFTSMSACDYSALCRDGKIGMKKILKDTTDNIKGWVQYKIKGKRTE